jgi:hypothetical protein
MRFPITLWMQRCVRPVIFLSIGCLAQSLSLCEAALAKPTKPVLVKPELVNTQAKAQVKSKAKPPIETPIVPPIESQTESQAKAQIAQNNLNSISVGVQVNQRSVIDSILVRGKEDGTSAIALDTWLVPLEPIAEALKLTLKPIENGRFEVRGVGIFTRLEPQDLQTDSVLGLAMTIGDLKRVLGIDVTFDVPNYALNFNHNWQPGGQSRRNGIRKSEWLMGLPLVSSSIMSLSTVSQSLTFSGTSGEGSVPASSSLTGNLTAIGTLTGGSWYLRASQAQAFNLSQWRLEEAQYFRPTDSRDYAIGTQPTFWPGQSSGQFVGLTAVQRSGFTPPHFPGSGFVPQQRLSSESIDRTITGEAPPGTLVQLVQGLGSETIVSETLVDSSGVYRFERLPFGISGLSDQYRVKLYPNGRLSSNPEIRTANFSNLPGQLSQGSSAWIISVGGNRNTGNSLLGELSNFRGGVAYRAGLSESLTVGAGAVYDRGTLGFGEFLFQPTKIPLQIGFSGLLGTEKGLTYNANLLYRPTSNWEFRVDADDFVRRFQVDWRNVTPGLGLRFGGNSRDSAFFVGFNASQNFGSLYTYADASIDTNQRVRWLFNSYFDRFQFFNRGNELSTSSELAYSFSSSLYQGHSLKLGYDTQNSGDALLSAGWRYRSFNRTYDGRNLWEVEAGYGFGSRGTGPILSAATNVIPGVVLRVRYDAISTLSGADTFRVELTPSFHVAPRLTAATTPNIEHLRDEGGILVQPFLDANANGRLDAGEEIYTEEPAQLLSFDSQSLQAFATTVNGDGILSRMKPGKYRVDLDPAGYPVGWTPKQNAYAVEVAPGGYTLLSVPMQKSFTVIGAIQNLKGIPIGGMTIVATPRKDGLKLTSVTNGSGIYTLDGMTAGIYDLTLNGKAATPTSIEIQQSAETLQELNFKVP